MKKTDNKPLKNTSKKNKKQTKKRTKYDKEMYVRKTFRKFHISKLRIVEIEVLTKERMKALGLYHTSYDDTIHIYANMIHEYQRALEQFVLDGKRYEVETEGGSTKKSGIVSAMEVLRKDIGTYSDRLQLNPRSMGNQTLLVKDDSKLGQFLQDFDENK